MNKSGWEEVEELIWEEIARDLVRERGVDRCLCFNDRFSGYLSGAALPFAVEHYSTAGRGRTAGLFLGWQVLEEGRSLLAPEEIFSSLEAGGEARLFGFYSSPRPEDLRGWERRFPAAVPPPPGSAFLGSVAGWLKNGPFDRYTLRKRGIYYDCRLQKVV